MKKLIIIGVVALAVVAGAVWMMRGSEEDGTQAGAGQQPPAVGVSVVAVKEQKIVFAENLPGRTSAFKVAEIRPQVNGIIVERAFTEGDDVKEGQQLYQIDPAPYKAAYESAKAQLQRAEANAKSVRSRSKRYGELVEVDAVSKQEYDDIKATLAQAEADIAVAKASVTQAKINLDYTKVYSPISGRIGKSSVTEGALVTANQADVLTKVTQLDPIYVDLTQSSTELMNLRSQMSEMDALPVTVKLENGKAYEHIGKLQFSDITVDETTGSVQLRAIFPNPDRILLPGLFVRAEVKLAEKPVLLIPQQAAVRDSKGNLSVWVLGDDNTVNPQPITTIRAYKDQWVIDEGVQAGEKIVVEGFQKIRPGAAVNPTMASSEEKDEAAPTQQPAAQE